jgi:hypothetical protein
MATIGDVVLVYQEERPTLFARIEDISPDPKPGWYQVKLLILQVPLAESVWTLKEDYINGEPFTMNGLKIRIDNVRGLHRPEGDESLLSHRDPKPF